MKNFFKGIVVGLGGVAPGLSGSVLMVIFGLYQKTIELRLFDEKRQKIKVGDKIVFTDNTTSKTLNTTVVKLHRFNTFNELYKSLPVLKCGYTSENVDKATPSDMEQYYSVEEQRKYGVVGIELCRPEQIIDECVVLLTKAQK